MAEENVAEKKKVNIQFWTLLGPVFVIATLFLTSFASISNRDLFLFTLAALVFCLKKRQKGLFYSLLALAALSLIKHYQIAAGHLWQLGIELSLSLGLFITYFSFEHMAEFLKALDDEKASQKGALAKLEEDLKKEADFHERQHKNFRYEVERVNLQLEEKKLELDSFKNMLESLKITLDEKEKEKEKILLQVKEKERQIALLREAIEEYKEKIQLDNDDELLAELKKTKLEKNKIEAELKNLFDKFNQNALLQKENENLLEKIKFENEKYKTEITLLSNLKEKLLGQINDLQNKSQTDEKNLNETEDQKELIAHYEEQILNFKKMESLYNQLKVQFEDKKNVLSETRKELFYVNEKLSAAQKAKELGSQDETDMEKDLASQLGSFEKEATRLEEENIELQDIVTILTKELDASLPASKEVKKSSKKKAAVKEKAPKTTKEKSSKTKEELLKYTNFEELP